jgi:hypothetical protein
MKRDDELIRHLLQEFEQQEDWLIMAPNAMGMSVEDRKRIGHIYLLCDAGMLTSVGRDTYRLTNQGHDFLEATRDEGLWQKTKDAVSETGGNASLEIVRQLAVGFLKKKISQHTDIDLS